MQDTLDLIKIRC